MGYPSRVETEVPNKQSYLAEWLDAKDMLMSEERPIISRPKAG